MLSFEKIGLCFSFSLYLSLSFCKYTHSISVSYCWWRLHFVICYCGDTILQRHIYIRGGISIYPTITHQNHRFGGSVSFCVTCYLSLLDRWMDGSTGKYTVCVYMYVYGSVFNFIWTAYRCVYTTQYRESICLDEI